MLTGAEFAPVPRIGKIGIVSGSVKAILAPGLPNASAALITSADGANVTVFCTGSIGSREIFSLSAI
jgi:hypothetical protein